jgi:hypothetical protein
LSVDRIASDDITVTVHGPIDDHARQEVVDRLIALAESGAHVTLRIKPGVDLCAESPDRLEEIDRLARGHGGRVVYDGSHSGPSTKGPSRRSTEGAARRIEAT